jgi:hypothetical protein
VEKLNFRKGKALIETGAAQSKIGLRVELTRRISHRFLQERAMYPIHHTRDEHSLIGLIEGLRDDIGQLIRSEVQLAKTELSEKASLLARNGMYLGIGAAVGCLSLIFLLIGVSFLIASGFEALGLSTGIALFLGFICIAVLSGIIAGALVAKAISAFSKETLVPEKTIATLQEIKEGGIEQVPIRRAPAPPEPEDSRTSEQIREDVERTRGRIHEEVVGVRRRLSWAALTTQLANHVRLHPLRSVGIGLGTGLAGFVLVRVGRLFGHKRAA